MSTEQQTVSQTSTETTGPAKPWEHAPANATPAPTEVAPKVEQKVVPPAPTAPQAKLVPAKPATPSAVHPAAPKPVTVFTFVVKATEGKDISVEISSTAGPVSLTNAPSPRMVNQVLRALQNKHRAQLGELKFKRREQANGLSTTRRQ
jgi:hypothetical protein